MCDQLTDVRTALSLVASRFDPDLVSVGEAARVVADAAAIEASAATLKALAAARAAEGGAYHGAGERSPADGLATAIGVGTGAARDLITTGRRLREQPRLAALAKSGELSAAKVSLVANASEAAPAAAPGLVDLAARGSLTALREECARVKASAVDAEERRRLIHSRRSLRTWTDVEGVWHLSAVGNPEDGAQVMAVLTPRIEAAFRRARAEARHEPPPAYAFDALVQLARDATCEDVPPAPPGEERAGPAPAAPAARRRPARRRRGAPVKLLVRIDYDTWLRGAARDGETCELVGYGPVAVSTVRDLVETGDPFVAAILTKGRELVGVAHLGRRPNAVQQSALQWLYPSCAVKDCPAQARLEMDHRIDWARTHYTVFDLLDLLCHHHHSLKTRSNWALVGGSGKRDFVPPTDPRHPRHEGARRAG